MIRSIKAANTISAVSQPKLSISATPNGANRNCPNDPAAVPAPSANERPSGGSNLLKADSTKQILHGQRKAEHVASPGKLLGHRLDEKANTRARAEPKQGDRAAADDDDERRAP